MGPTLKKIPEKTQSEEDNAVQFVGQFYGNIYPWGSVKLLDGQRLAGYINLQLTLIVMIFVELSSHILIYFNETFDILTY